VLVVEREESPMRMIGLLPMLLGLAMTSVPVFAEPAPGEAQPTADEPRCPEMRRKQEDLGFNKKVRKERCNNFECLDGTIVRAQHSTNMALRPGAGGIIGARSAIATWRFLMTDKGSYYLGLYSYVYLRSGKKQGYEVRATEDALTLPFEDGTKLELSAVCDTSTYCSRMEPKDHYFCGFYKISREQLDILSKKKVSGFQQFVVAVGDEIEARRLKHTEDGRTYIDWVPKVQSQESVDEQGVAPLLNKMASCAMTWE